MAVINAECLMLNDGSFQLSAIIKHSALSIQHSKKGVFYVISSYFKAFSCLEAFFQHIVHHHFAVGGQFAVD
ncbi:MAG: hypothetical protein FWE80_00420 [Oscillospiraceae bacterium]|nr:hypothetical protein [Oscillospiraceae bacterium]